MIDDGHDIYMECFLQVKVSKETKIMITELAKASHRPVADIIRGSLYFGLPILEMVLKMEGQLAELVKALLPAFDEKAERPIKEIFDKFR